MDRVARWGPLARAPSALKGGTLPKLSIFFAVEGAFWRKNKFSKYHNAEKLKGGPFGIFKHPFCCKISKKLKGDPLERTKFRKRVSQCRKTERRDPLGFFNIHSVAKHQKIEEGNFFRKKSQCRKKLKGGFFNIHSVAKQL